MALIGQIAISMTTDARKFNAGIMQATASLRAFSRLGASLGKASPLTGIGVGAYIASKGLAQIFGQTRKLVPNLLMLGTGVPREMGFSFAQAFAAIGMGVARTVGGLGIMAISVARVGVGLAGWGLGVVARGLGVVREAINHLGRAAAITGAVAGYGLVKIVGAASDVAEAMNKTRQEFGEHAGIIINEANRLSAAFGISKVATLDAAAAYGSMFRGAGYTSKQSAELAAQFARLTQDTESYYNLAKGEAFGKILGGLTGEIRPLREIGVLIDDNKVKAQAYAMGLAKAGQEVSQEAKVQARIPLILAGLAKAQGDRARTATDVANAWREVLGRVLSLAEVIGAALEPVTKSVLGEMGTALGALQMFWADNQNAVVSWASATIGASGEATQSLGIVQQSVGFIADAWQFVGVAFSGVQSYITSGLATIIGWLDKLQRGLEWAVTPLGTAVKHNDFLATWSEDLKNLSGKQWEEFQTKLAKPPASEGVNAYFDAARAKTEALRAEIGKIPAANPKVVAGGVTKEAKELKFASAMTRGSSEAASTILRSRYSGGKTADEQKKISANTAKANEHLAKIASVVGATGMGLTFMADF